jgi:streptogramin lyase
MSGALFGAAPALTAQSVTFALSEQPILPVVLNGTSGIAVDSAGDVFVGDSGNHHVVELPLTATGYGPQITLPFSHLDCPGGIAVDKAGDVFVADCAQVVELPKTPTAYGEEITLPFSSNYGLNDIAVDGSGNVFVTYDASPTAYIVELPKTAAGYDPQVVLAAQPPPVSYFYQIALDPAGNLFYGQNYPRLVGEVPKTTSGYGPQTTLADETNPFGVTADQAGNVFVADPGNGWVLEYRKTATGHASPIILPITGLDSPYRLATDTAGDLFVTDRSKVKEFQFSSVNFGSINVCAPRASAPAPCRETLTLKYNVTASGTLGTPAVLTGGALDFPFTLAPGSTCTGAVLAGSTCTVNVKFKPGFAGERDGVVQITDASGKVLATTLVYGNADHSGFAANSLALNGGASIVGTSLVLTDGGPGEAASAYDPTPVFVQKFTTAFDFQLTHAKGDGFTFTIQNIGNLIGTGGHGGGLGYEGLTPSAAIKFDLYDNAGEGTNSTGLYLDGAAPNVPAIDLTGTGIDLHSGDEMHAGISYNGTTLTLTLTDLATGATWLHPFTVDIPRAVGGDTAYVGFTASTGSSTAIQQILDWQFTSTE